MAEYRQFDLTLGGIGALLLRHKFKVIICPLLAIALGAAVLIYCPRTYRSEAQLFMRIGRESMGIDPTATAGQTVPLQQFDRKDEIKSSIQVLKSRAIISKAVDKLGSDVILARNGNNPKKSNPLVDKVTAPLHQLLAYVKSLDPVSEREEAIIEVERNLNVESERESTLIVVQYDAESPQLAQTVCNALVDVFQEEHMRIHRNEGSQPFFAEQQKRLRTELDDSLLAVQAAKNEMNLGSVEARRGTLESQFNAIELDRLNTRQQLAAATARSAELEAQLAKTPEKLVESQKTVPNAGADMLRDQLYALEVKSMDLKARYSDSHPLVQAVEEQLKKAKQVVTEQKDQRVETTDNVNPIYRQLSLELKQEQGVLAGLKARAVELAEQKGAVLADLRTVNGAEFTLDQLNRQAELARDKFLQYSRNMEEAFIDVALESQKINNVSVVQPATLAERPVRPSKAMVALATLVLAVAGTGALVLLSERPSHYLYRDEDFEPTNGAPINGAAVNGAAPAEPSHRPALSKTTNGRRPAPSTLESWI